MSIINQASKRLEQLRQAGVELPWADTNAEPDAASPAATPVTHRGPAVPHANQPPASIAARATEPAAAPPAMTTPLAAPMPAPTPRPPAPGFTSVVPLSIRATPPESATPQSEGVFLSSIVTPAQHAQASAAAAPPITAAPLAAEMTAPVTTPVPTPETAPSVPSATPAPAAAAPAAVANPTMSAMPKPAPVERPVMPAPSTPATPALKRPVNVAPTKAPSAPTADQDAAAGSTSKHSATVQLDLNALALRKLLVPSCDDRGLINEFRALKRPLVTNALGKNAANVRRGNVIVVTSAMPGEGKTYCAINLALSMAAQVDNTVLLVDADVVKPALSQRLGLPPTLGLLDLLSEDARPMHEVLLRTNVPKLSLIPSSAPRPDSAERVSSDRMDALVEELATRYPDRIIVIDAPPLLLTNESRILASLAGQVVMVVEAGKTTMRAAADAFQAVESCPVVMSVLNKRSQALRGYGYGYGYGDGY